MVTIEQLLQTRMVERFFIFDFSVYRQKYRHVVPVARMKKVRRLTGCVPDINTSRP
jgi:hypothetical protein